MAYFFDSYGEMPNRTIKEYLSKNYKKIYFNRKIFQSVLSNVCGHYVITFLYFMSIGIGFETVMQLFNRTNNPDTFVYRFVTNDI